MSCPRRGGRWRLENAFQAFSQNVFAEGALSAKTKQLIAVAVAHVTQCPYCIRGHTKAALGHGVTRQELMEAIWVAAKMRAGAAYAHSTIAVTAIDETEAATLGNSRTAVAGLAVGTQRCGRRP